jgi:hypothetical protein
MWHDMFVEQIPLAEKVIRTIGVYVLLMVLFRLTGKRGLAAMNTFDFIVIFLLSNVVQNAVIGNDNSLLGGMVLELFERWFNRLRTGGLVLWAWLRHIAVRNFGVETRGADHVPSSRVMRGRLVVVAAAADGVAHPSRDHHYQADDQQDDSDDQADMRVGEGRDERREEESKDDKDDSEDDHDVYLVSIFRWGGAEILGGSVFKGVF